MKEKSKNVLLVIQTVLIIALVVFSVVIMNNSKVTTGDCAKQAELATTDVWKAPTPVRVKVRIEDTTAVPGQDYSLGIRNDSLVFEIVKNAFLNNPFRTRTGNEWWLDYFPAFNAYKVEVMNSDIVLVAWNREAGKFTTFEDNGAMNWLVNGYVSTPLWTNSVYATPAYDTRKAFYLGGKWANSHKNNSANKLYVLKTMVNF